jgi:hypothetical protein
MKLKDIGEKKNFKCSINRYFIFQIFRIHINKTNKAKIIDMRSINGSSFLTKYVQVKIEFIQIGKIDTFKEIFNAYVKITAEWIDNEVKNNKYDPNKDWNPMIYIENKFEDSETVSYSLTKRYNETWITETRKSEGYFKLIKF